MNLAFRIAPGELARPPAPAPAAPACRAGMRRKLQTFGTLLLLLSAWQAGAALYIPAKAWLAQRLLERAWAHTVAGEGRTKPWPWADTWPVARLHAPSHRADLIVLDGASGRTLAFAPALASGSAGPGLAGVTVIAGHRDTHFRFLRELKTGDPLELEDAHGVRERFRVSATEIVDSRTSGLNVEASGRALALVTCFPFDAVVPGGPMRYLVTAEAAE
jgi:sortase A